MLRKVNDKKYTFAGNKIASFLTQNVRFAVANMHPDLLFGFSIKDEKTTFGVAYRWNVLIFSGWNSG